MGDAPFAATDDPARPGASRLALGGRVRVTDAAALLGAAVELATRGGDVTVDCGAAEYLDPAALQVVLCLGRELTTSGRRCDVTGVAGQLAEEFRLAGLGGAVAGSSR